MFIVLILLQFVSIQFCGQNLAQAATQKFEISPQNSEVKFSVVNLIITTARGRFKEFSGQLEIDSDFKNSKFAGTIQVASLDTDEKTRDEHLMEVDYFNSKEFPTLTFVSEKVEGTPDSFTIGGPLTIRGQTRPVVWRGKLDSDKTVLDAETKINRRDFGMVAGPTIKNEVTLKVVIRGINLKP